MKPLFLLLVIFGPLAAQIVIPNGAPDSYNFDGRVNEWTSLPPTFPLQPSQSGGRQGVVWIRQIPEGLLIAGSVDGSSPDFAANIDDMTRKDHVEIWLAPPAQPRFPPIAYGEHSEEVPTIEACGDEQKCREWFQSMLVHRQLMARTLVRQYSMSPAVVFEAFAKPAYERMLGAIRDNLQSYVTALVPTGAPSFRTAPGEHGGYTFEALLPWEAFPPFASLQLKKLRLMVGVLSAHRGSPDHQPYSSTSASRKYGDPSSFDVVVLEKGRQFRITACGYPLEGHDEVGENGPALFFPLREDDVMQVFRLVNFESVYSYYPSPIVEVTKFAEKPMPGNAVVCGPRLAIARNGTVQRFHRDVDPAKLDVKLEPDGGYLVLSGPSWKRATKSDEDGCCEGLPMLHFHIWVISPAGKIREIFEDHVLMSGMAMGVVDMDVDVSPDAKKVTTIVEWMSAAVGDNHKASWDSTTYCRHGMAYRKCGHNFSFSPPKKKTAESSTDK